jgi:hypothetical protein
MTPIVKARKALFVLLTLAFAAGCSNSGDGDRRASPPPSPALPVVQVPPDPRILSGAPGVDADPGHVVRPAAPLVASPGQMATAVFQTRPGSTCQIELRYPNQGGPGQRLDAATADEGGRVIWTWHVGDDVERGEAAALVVCSGGARGEAHIRIL